MRKCYLFGLMIWLLFSSMNQGVDPIFCDNKADGIYANPLDCNAFYICIEKMTYPLRCQTGLAYDPKCTCCNWPENYLCETSKAHGSLSSCQCSNGYIGQYYRCSILSSNTVDCVTNSPCFSNLSNPNSVCNNSRVP